jgi:16S rRNA G1207 methylase RsmC
MNTPSDSPADSHYFAESPTTASKRQQFSLVVAGRELTFATDAGVFSQHGLDKGTAVLLDVIQRESPLVLPPGSLVCDLGCGTGIISLALAITYPECTVLAVDTNERARQLCAENAQTNGLTNVQVVHPDEVQNNIELGVLWSNPPIRIGKDALHALLITWLSRLTSTGRARLVVGKNLGADSLSKWLTTQGYPTTKMASSKGFRVLDVRPHQ